MKVVILTITLFLASSFFQNFAFAQTEDSQKAFELEEENIEIKDTEAERIGAQKEAKHQQQIEAQRAAQLKKLQDEKARVSKKAKIDIAIAEAKRIKAEKEIQRQNAEIAKLKSQIDLLKTQVASAEEKAKTAEQTVDTGRSEIEKIKKEQADLSVRKRKAEMANVIYSARILRLKAEYRRMSGRRSQTLKQTKQAERDSYQNKNTQNQLTRDISSVKENKN
jgi:hypothetical protein